MGFSPSALAGGALNALRRALAIALAMGEAFAAQSGLAELKKANLEGRVPEPNGRREFGRVAGGRGFGGAVSRLPMPPPS
jgi:hypothetical protein